MFSMPTGEAEAVLRCPRCNKPFDKESSLKRHGYYCRSRGVEGPGRSRSCRACAKRKARCDNRQPACSRCHEKKLQCVYPANLLSNGSREEPSSSSAAAERHTNGDDGGATPRTTQSGGKAASLQAIDGQTSIFNHLDLEVGVDDDGQLERSTETLGPDNMYFDDSWGHVNFEVADFLNSIPGPEVPRHSASMPTPGPLFPLDGTTYRTQQVLSSYSKPSIPAQIPYRPRSLTERPNVKQGSGNHGTFRLTLQTLKSYPLMLLRDRSNLPPFIHPRLMASWFPGSSGISGKDDDMEPVNNCISLLHMLGSGVPGRRKLFWRNVRSECELLCERVLGLNKWQILAALQAVAIYVILRLDEGPQEDNDVDKELVAAVYAASAQLVHIKKTKSAGASHKDVNWQDWIFEESTRRSISRVCVTLGIINILVHFEPVAFCQPTDVGLLFGPLPARKQLWEADDELSWWAVQQQLQGGKGKGTQEQTGDGLKAWVDDTFALGVDGGLVKVTPRPDSCPSGGSMARHGGCRSLQTLKSWGSTSTASWDEWCTGMDSLGNLVMFAASLTG